MAFRKGLPITEFPGEDEPIEAISVLDDPIGSALGFLPLGAGIRAARLGQRILPGAARGIGGAAGRAAKSIGRFGFEMLPNSLQTPLRRGGEAVGRALEARAARVADSEAVGSALGRIRGGVGRPAVEIRGVPRETGRVVGEIKPRKPFRPKRKAKPKKGSAESRTMTGKAQEAAREKGREQVSAGGRDLRRLGGAGRQRAAKSQAMRGASRPELERRAAALERLPEPTGPPEVDDLTALLEQSLRAEQAMTEQALSPLERAAVRALLRGEVIP
ncbi:MAG TPA: hypothetical protein VJL59_05530 [Anaerolineales bacterium]|nr:hypothetical protein [Anaerolineales bacterium]